MLTIRNGEQLHTASFQGDHWDVRPPSDEVSDILEDAHAALVGRRYMGSAELVEFHVGTALGLQPKEPSLEYEDGSDY